MEKTMDSTSAKIHAISSVVVATIMAIGMIIAAVILAGGDYGRDLNRCTSTSGGGALKAMDKNVVMNVMMFDGKTEIGMQSARYDYDANTILVETPSNMTGFREATVVIDFTRSAVFTDVHGHSLCLASALHGDMMDMADMFTNFMRDGKQQAIDIAAARIKEMNYAIQGEIAAGYVTNSNGPIISALCTGDASYWTEQTSVMGGGRRNRAVTFAGTIRICIFGFCFDIAFDSTDDTS
eukprot:XP_003724635.1 PREDICTED: uncharacterized protein LOC100893680 [Strongylocentrotus purpuratus]